MLSIRMTALDAIDHRAIELLVRDGRLTWAELGAALDLSPPAAAERVRRLITDGVIAGFSARVAADRVGFPLTVLISVRLERHEERRSFLRFVQTCAEIQECHHVTGEDDFVLKVRCSGVPRLEELLGDEMRRAVSGLRTRTTLVLSTVKDTPALPSAGSSATAAPPAPTRPDEKKRRGK